MEETSLPVLALPVLEFHFWYSRPRGCTLDVFATTTGKEGDLNKSLKLNRSTNLNTSMK